MVWADRRAGWGGAAEVSEREDEIAALRRELAETRELATATAKAAMSTLSAVGSVIDGLRARSDPNPQARNISLKTAEDHLLEALADLALVMRERPDV